MDAWHPLVGKHWGSRVEMPACPITQLGSYTGCCTLAPLCEVLHMVTGPAPSHNPRRRYRGVCHRNPPLSPSLSGASAGLVQVIWGESGAQTARGALLFHGCVSDLGCTLQIMMVKGCNWPLGTSRVDDSAGRGASPVHPLAWPSHLASVWQVPPANCSGLRLCPQPVSQAGDESSSHSGETEAGEK